MRRDLAAEEGFIAEAAVGGLAVAGLLGTAVWLNPELTARLMRAAGGEITLWVLKAGDAVIELISTQAATTPSGGDWWSPLQHGPAVPLWSLAALVAVLALLGEVCRGLVTGNTATIAQAAVRAVTAGVLATAGGSLMLLVGDALSGIGAAALEASGASLDAPLVPLQQILIDTAEQKESGAELFLAFFCAVVIVVAGLAIYLTLALRPVLLAIVIVWLPVAHALSVWRPFARAQARVWAIGLAILLADAAILTTFAVVNTVGKQPEGIDRLLFGTAGMVLAALSPSALARIVAAPEVERAAAAMRSGGGSAVGAGTRAVMMAGTAAAAVGVGAARARSSRRSSALQTPGAGQ